MYIKCDADRNPIDFSEKMPDDMFKKGEWLGPWDWKSFEEVCTVASFVTSKTGDVYLPVDRSDSVSPRYDIVKCPKVGDPVSYSFNGDTYPDGHIKRITQNMTVVTDSGSRYRRYKQTSGWRKEGGTWWLVRGHIYDQNPHF